MEPPGKRNSAGRACRVGRPDEGGRPHRSGRSGLQTANRVSTSLHSPASVTWPAHRLTPQTWTYNMRGMEIPRFPRKFTKPDLSNFLRQRLSQTIVLWPEQAIPLVGYMAWPNEPAARDDETSGEGLSGTRRLGARMVTPPHPAPGRARLRLADPSRPSPPLEERGG